MSRLVPRPGSIILRPRVEIGPDGSVGVSLGVEPGHDEVPLLADALDAVEGLAESTGREVAVVLDEVQQIVVEHGEGAERQLRATVQRHRRVGYVFAGSATRLLTAMTGDPDRPFYRLGERLFVREVPRAAFRDFLEEGFTGSGHRVASGACDHLLDRAEEVPYDVQRLAHEAWEMLRARTAGDRLDTGVVEQALRRIVIREDPAYTQIWSGLTRNQKKTLKAVIRAGGLDLQSAEVGRRFGIPPSSVQVALAALEDRHVIRREPAGGRVRYRAVDPFFGAWLEVGQGV